MKSDLTVYLKSYGVQRALVEIIAYVNKEGEKCSYAKNLEKDLELALNKYSNRETTKKKKSQ